MNRRGDGGVALACLLVVLPAALPIADAVLAAPAVSVRGSVPAAPVIAPGRYAVLPFVFSPPRADLQWLTEALSFGVADRLERLGFTAATRRERIDAAETLGLSSPSPITLAGRIKLARGVRAERAVTGTLSFRSEREAGQGSGQIVVDALLIDVERGSIVGRRTISGTLNELFSMIDEVALEVAWQDPSPPGPEARRALRSIPHPPLPSFEAVVKAVLEKDDDRQQSAIAAAMPQCRREPELTRRLADLMIEAGRDDEALEMLATLDPAGQPDPWRLHLDRGELLFARGDLEAARGAASRSLLARDNAAAHVLLARTALARGEASVARVEADRAAALDPGEPRLPELMRRIGAAATETSSR